MSTTAKLVNENNIRVFLGEEAMSGDVVVIDLEKQDDGTITVTELAQTRKKPKQEPEPKPTKKSGIFFKGDK